MLDLSARCYVTDGVSERAISAPTIRGTTQVAGDGRRRLPSGSVVRHPWVIVAMAVVLVSTLFVVASGVRPEFDTYGWLVWGRQALHWNLDTNSAPSWKPLTFLFTFIYALAGDGELWLWMVTAMAAALAGAVFGGRIAYRLAGPAPGRGYARIVAAVFGGLGVLGIVGYGHLILIAASDPMDVTLCLAAIDCHMSARPRATWVLLVLLSLGRPEAWTVAGLYALWAWRAIPSMRSQIALGVAVVPAMWFGIAAVTSRSWSIASDIALGSTRTLPGSPISRVPGNFLSLYELPMKSAVLCAVVLAAARRERTWLLLAGSALVWLATWAALALHGWNPSARYLFEPAAVLIVLAGAAVGWVLANAPRHTVLRWAAVTAVIGLVVALALPARNRVRLAHNGIVFGRTWARQLSRLHAVIDTDGGAKRILACGQAVSYLGYQTILAWDLDRNVSDIGYQPGKSIRRAKPIVLFEPYGAGWRVRPIHTNRAACSGLSITAALG
jgi:hypothetical protein